MKANKEVNIKGVNSDSTQDDEPITQGNNHLLLYS